MCVRMVNVTTRSRGISVSAILDMYLLMIEKPVTVRNRHFNDVTYHVSIIFCHVFMVLYKSGHRTYMWLNSPKLNNIEIDSYFHFMTHLLEYMLFSSKRKSFTKINTLLLR